VFENRVLRRIFGQKRDEVTGEWRKLHNEELHNLYSSSSIIRMIKSKRMRWAVHVVRLRRRGTLVCYWLEGQEERDHWEDQDVGGCIILVWILERWDGMMWPRLVRFRIVTSGRFFVNAVMNLWVA
jgi:hypothetical protein